MKVICSTVIRAAEQGSVHGGLYVIDVDSDEVLEYVPYAGDFDNENTRGGERGLRGIAVLEDRIIVADSSGLIQLDKETYTVTKEKRDRGFFKSIHEICYFDKHIWVTSTGYDAVAKIDLDFNLVEFWEILGESKDDHKIFTGKRQIDPEEAKPDDKYHINSISAFSGRLVFSGLITSLYDFESMDVAEPMPEIEGIKSFQHNFYEYDDCSLINMTSLKHLGVIKDGQSRFFPIPATHYAKFSIDKIAENNWNRGLTRGGNYAIVGSSPARLLLFDMNKLEFVKQLQIEEDIKHCIHGLEILEV
tara:strand:- start:2683 stop:3594 length:912 start_codon:yes stop_codon:yes gene_type:complete